MNDNELGCVHIIYRSNDNNDMTPKAAFHFSRSVYGVHFCKFIVGQTDLEYRYATFKNYRENWSLSLATSGANNTRFHMDITQTQTRQILSCIYMY